MLEKIGIIIAFNLALYFKTLRHKFVSDDFTVSKNPPAFKNAWHKAWLRFIGAAKIFSPSPQILKANDKWFFVIAKTEEFEHLLALLIHIAICISIFFAFGASNISFVAALLYGANPINNQGTIWPGGRGYALPILSLMLSMALPLLSPILLYFCSWYTIGFLAPLALIGSTKWYLLVLMPFIWYLHSRKYTTAIKLKSSVETFDHDKKWSWRKAVIFIKTYGFYLTLCLVPFRITFYHNQLQSMAGNDIMRKRAESMDRYFFIGLAGIIGTAYYSLHDWNPIAWALVAFFITIAPFCNVVRANQEIAERFCALPNVFLMFALAQVITIYPALVAIFVTFYATRTFYTLIMYKDEYFITELAIIEDPHAWWAWHCRAMKRWDTQSYKEALILWVMARMISPKEFKVLMNIATCLRLLGNTKEADDFLVLAEQNIVAGQEKAAAQYIEDHRRGKLPILL
jgi:hypothetical protein